MLVGAGFLLETLVQQLDLRGLATFVEQQGQLRHILIPLLLPGLYELLRCFDLGESARCHIRFAVEGLHRPAIAATSCLRCRVWVPAAV